MGIIKYIEIKTDGNILRGISHKPSGESKGKVLIIHGYFSSNKIGSNRLFFQIAEAIASVGFEAYRFDLSGMGESDGIIENITYESHVRDIENIVKKIREKNEKIIVVAHCMGCSLAMENILKNTEYYKEAIFLAPYFTNAPILDLFFPDANQKEDLYKKGHTYRKGLYADASFFIKNNDYWRFVTNYNNCKIHINIIAGDSDQFIPKRYNEELFQRIGLQPRYIEGADHNFNKGRSFLIDNIIEYITDNK